MPDALALRTQTAADCPPDQVADLLSRAFTGYFVPVAFNTAALYRMVREDSVDLSLSQVLLRGDEEAGVALVARRGWHCRLASFAILPEHRGQGNGRWLMGQLLEQARLRGSRSYVLECLEQNEAGIRLYRGMGFETVRRLVEYEATDIPALADQRLEEVDLGDVAACLTAHGLPDLPWQISAATLVQIGPPTRGYRLGDALAAISNPDREEVYLRSLVVPTEARGRGEATRLVRALAAEHPGKVWKVSPHTPEEMVPRLFENLGFRRGPLSQFQMARPLSEHSQESGN